MPKLSPAYREDPIEEVPRELMNYLDDNFLKNLENIAHKNPKILVVYSGGNAVGKSTLSAKISEELHGLVLQNDTIKALIMNYNKDFTRDQINTLTWSYSMSLYTRLSSLTTNGLIVRDGVIDWYYDRILPLFSKQGYELFIVRWELSPEKQKELILSRGDTPIVTAERLLTILDDHKIHSKRFLSDYTPDIVLTDETVFDHDSVIKKLIEKVVVLDPSYFQNTITAKFKADGLEVEVINDKPNFVYPKHRHGAVSLAVIKGSIKIALDNGPMYEYTPGSVIKINNNQPHAAQVGPGGCSYIFAASHEEMVRQGLRKK